MPRDEAGAFRDHRWHKQVARALGEDPIAFFKARQEYYRSITSDFSPEQWSEMRRFLSDIVRIEPETSYARTKKYFPANPKDTMLRSEAVLRAGLANLGSGLAFPSVGYPAV